MRQVQGKFILCDLDGFAQWLAETPVSRVIQRVQNHHTFIPAYQHFKGGNHFALLQGMENSHIERGFAEIGQNLTTFPDGTVAVCRSFDTIPAGIKGGNTAAICIENLGSFDKGQDAMRDVHRRSIVQVNALLCKRFNLKPNSETLIYHHWFDLTTGERRNGAGTTKSCPGTNFFGGNKVADAEANFFPLIGAAIRNLEGAPPVQEQEILFKATVIADSLNVRNGPGASHQILKVLKKGAAVDVFEKSVSWRRIHRTENLWVNGRFLKKKDPQATPLRVRRQRSRG